MVDSGIYEKDIYFGIRALEICILNIKIQTLHEDQTDAF